MLEENDSIKRKEEKVQYIKDLIEDNINIIPKTYITFFNREITQILRERTESINLIIQAIIITITNNLSKKK